MDIHNEFLPTKKIDIVFYAGKAVLNKPHAFWDINNDPWNFSQAIGYTFKIWEEREGGLLMIDWSDTNGNLTNNGDNIIYLNAQATDTSIGLGKYYYEIEYLIAGGYTILIGAGEAKFI